MYGGVPEIRRPICVDCFSLWKLNLIFFAIGNWKWHSYRYRGLQRSDSMGLWGLTASTDCINCKEIFVGVQRYFVSVRARIMIGICGETKSFYNQPALWIIDYVGIFSVMHFRPDRLPCKSVQFLRWSTLEYAVNGIFSITNSIKLRYGW